MQQKAYVYRHLIVFMAGLLMLSAGLAHAENPRLEQLREAAKARAEQTQERILQLRQQAQERMAQAKENAKNRINQISDAKKRAIAQRIVDQLNHVNQVWTNHFANVLDRLDDVLQKIQSRTDKVAANGTDVSSVATAIQKAKTAIATARTAVTAQAQKTYALNLSTIPQGTDQGALVSQLRNQFKTLHEQLRKDLTALRDGVIKDARQAVHDALQALRQLPHVDEEPATNTQNQSQ